MVTVRAIYENGQIRLLEDIELKDGQELQVKILDMPKKRGKRIPDLHPGAFVFNTKLDEEISERKFGLHRGMIEMSDDFDAPLPDSFWFGEDE